MRNAVLAMMVVGVVALQASAVFIENTSTSTVIFYDDFESASVDGYPDNGAYPGHWTAYKEGGGQTAIQIKTGPVFEGQQSLRQAAGSLLEYPVCKVFANFASQATPGDAIHVEFMYYTPGTHNGKDLMLRVEGTGGSAGFYMWDNQTVVVDLNTVDTGLRMNVGAWNKCEVDFTLGSSTYDVTINGTTASGRAAGSAITDVDNTQFRLLYRYSEYYIDASRVPEPMTLSLLAVGAVMAIFRRRRA